jgi:hypothetical protein
MKLSPIHSISQVKTPTHHISLEWPLAFAIWMIAGAAIFANAYLHSRGYLTSDSIAYLRQSAFLLDGLGFYSSYTDDLFPKFFSTWPLGYPLSIAATGLVFNLTPFWASKLLNLILLAAAFLALKGLFGRDDWVAALFFLSGSMISVFSHTWSEGMFITAELFFILSLVKFSNSYQLRYAIYILLSMVALFLVRYIGVFVLIVIAINCSTLLYQKDYRRMLTLTVISGLFFAVVAAYLYNNHRLTGYLTGVPKSAASETTSALIIALAKQQVVEFNFVYSFLPHNPIDIGIFLLVLIAPVAITIYWLKLREQIAPDSGATDSGAIDGGAQVITDVQGRANQWRYFLLTGMVYWVVLVSLRFVTQFDLFNHRLLAPASILFYLALLSLLQTKRPDWFRGLAYVLIGLAIVSIIYNVVYRPLQMFRSNEKSFPVVLEEIARQYQDVPAGSLVLCGDEHLQYLRPDLVTLSSHDCNQTLGDRLLERYGSRHQGPVYLVQEGLPVRIDSTWLTSN